MAWIKTVAPEEADRRLGRIYDAAVRRAGRVFNIVRLQSLNPPVLRASMALYQEAVLGDSPLTRAQREMIATVVSKANGCHYWTLAHAEDLRSEVRDDELVEAVKTDYRTAALDEPTRGLLDYAVKLTEAPGSMTEQDVDHLRQLGWSDRAIHDAAQVTAYFNYINRLTNGLGVDLEPEMPERP